MIKPEWLKVRIPSGENYNEIAGLIKKNNIHTICQEAKCPNIAECFSRKTATFLILGNVCTRNCHYCNVSHGIPMELDNTEPIKVSNAIKTLGLNYVVLTSVTRDDLKDGGAGVFAETIDEIRKINKDVSIELLTPDFINEIELVLSAKPNVFGHNIETVRRLFPSIRPEADYQSSLDFLNRIKEINPEQFTKSGLMIGLGETSEEIIETLEDLKKVKVDIVTIGQYLQPSEEQINVKKYYTPVEFKNFEGIGRNIGFKIFSAPLARSSYHAEKLN